MNTNTTRTLESVRAEVIAKAPVSCRGIYEKAVRSKAFAIKAMCLSCAGNVRAEVTHCSTYACPLFPHRPYQAGSDDAATPECDDNPDDGDDDSVVSAAVAEHDEVTT